MNDNDLIERLWAGREEDAKMSREEIAQALRPRVARSTWLLKGFLWLYLAVLLATLVLQGLNLAGYRSNAAMLAAHACVTVAAIGLSGFAVHLAGRIGRLERVDGDLAELVRRRLAFFRDEHELSLWAYSLAMLLLVWALTTWIDNADGVYRINRPWVFFGTLLGMLVFVYGATKASHRPLVRELRAVAEDLEAQMLERTLEADAATRRWRRWQLVLAVLLSLTVLLGLWVAWHGLG